MTSDEVWRATKRALIRALYDAIEAHELRGEEYINVAWLRDYVDDIAVHYPDHNPHQS